MKMYGILVAFALFVCSVTAAEITSFNATPGSTTVGGAVDYTLNFTLPTETNLSSVNITFPAGFDISNAWPSSFEVINNTGTNDSIGQIFRYFIDPEVYPADSVIQIVVSNVVNKNTIGTYNLTLTTYDNESAKVDEGGSATFTLTAGTATRVDADFTTAAPTAGINFTGNISISDKYGNPVVGNLNFGSNDPLAVLPGNGTSNGTGISFMLGTSGSYVINVVAATNESAVNSTTFTVSAGAAHSVLVAVLGSQTVTAGDSIIAQFVSRDKFGNLKADTYNFASSDSQATLEGDGLANNTNGTFILKTRGSKTITATSVGNSSATNVTTFTVNAAGISLVRAYFTSTSVTAGTAFNISFVSFDPYDNEISDTYNFSSSDGSAVLQADGLANNTNGSFTLITMGAKTITATSLTNDSAANTTTFAVAGATAASVQYVLANSTSLTAGQGVLMSFTSKDRYGNEVSDTYTFTSSDSQANLSFDGIPNNTNGTFILKTRGSKTITATSATNTSASNTSSAFTVSAASLSRVRAYFTSTSVTAGTAFNISFRSFDWYDNELSDTYNFTSSDGSATLQADGLANNTNGSFTLVTIGSRTVVATSITNATAINTTTFTVAGATTATVQYVLYNTSSLTAGQGVLMSFTSKDKYGNEVADTYTFASSDSRAVLASDGLDNNTNGTFVLKTRGSTTITITSVSNSSAINTSETFTVVASGLARVRAYWTIAYTTSRQAGVSFTGYFKSFDLYDNEISDTYNFTNDTTGTVPANGSLANNTLGTFTLVTLGSRSLTVTSQTNESAMNTTPLNVSVGPVNKVKIWWVTPDSVIAGNNVSINATSMDKYGNLVPDNYTFTSTDAQADLPSSPVNNTLHGVTFKTAGSQTITVTSNSNSSASNVSSTVNTTLVNVSTVAQIWLTPFAPTLAYGGTQQFTATAVDAYGNVNITYNNSVGVLMNFTYANGTANGSINSSGFFASYSAGTVNVTVNSTGGVSNTTTVTISAAATPTPTTTTGNSVTGGTVSSSDQSVPEATPTTAATPTPQADIPTAPKTVVIDESSAVTGTFTATTTTLQLSYSGGSSGFAGSVTYTLPLDYDDYMNGKIKITPKPKRVRRGSLILEWDVSLQPNQEFKATVNVEKPVDPKILQEINSPVAKKLPSTGSSTPAPTGFVPTSTAKASAAAAAAQAGKQDNSGYIILVVAIVLLGVYLYFTQIKEKKQHRL